jgi:hypothetical protein
MQIPSRVSLLRPNYVIFLSLQSYFFYDSFSPFIGLPLGRLSIVIPKASTIRRINLSDLVGFPQKLPNY